MSTTYYLNNQILDYNLGSTAYSVPSTIYMGLSTGAVTISGGAPAEPSGGSYSRVAITNDTSNWNTASLGLKTNKTAITFPESTTAWGTITYIFFADQIGTGAGNILYFEQLPINKIVQVNTTVYFAIGAVTIQMTNT